MSLATTTVSLEYTSITADRLSGVITDNTVFTSPARASVGVFLSGDKMKKDNTVSEVLTVTSNNNNPETDTAWTFTRPDPTQVLKDGWTRFKYVAVEDYSGGITYALYDAAFDPATNNVYRSLQASNVGHALSNISWWELISDPSSLALNKGEANESANIASLIYEIEVSATAELAYANLIWLNSQLSGEADREQNVDLYELFDIWVNALYVADDRSEHPQGEIIARRLESIAQQEGLI